MKYITQDDIDWMELFFGESFRNASINFVKSFGEDVRDFTMYHSGGGCCHTFVLTNDYTVHSLHNVDEDEEGFCAERSHLKFATLNSYLDSDDEQIGFGWEFKSPNYDERQFRFK